MAYTKRTLTVADLKFEFRTHGTDGDVWGTTMHWWFEVCEHLGKRGASIPADWQYGTGHHPAPDRDDWTFPALNAATTPALRAFGDILNGLDKQCRAKGLNY